MALHKCMACLHLESCVSFYFNPTHLNGGNRGRKGQEKGNQADKRDREGSMEENKETRAFQLQEESTLLGERTQVYKIFPGIKKVQRGFLYPIFHHSFLTGSR